MRIVLQHVRSLLYFCGPGTWTRELSEAVDFRHSQHAIEFAREHRLTGVQVMVAFIDADSVEAHTFPIESPPQVRAVAASA